MQNARHITKVIVSYASDLIFGSKCVVCSTPGERICSTCLSRTTPHPHTKSDVRIIHNYHSPTVKKLLWSLKYEGKRVAARTFAEHLHDVVLEDITEDVMFHSSTKLLLVPIPLHPIRKRQRGYNQSELICKELSFINPELLDLNTSVLYRKRNTQTQAHLHSKKARIENVRDCFSCKDTGVLKGRTVLLVDDITTTGATLHEAAKSLKKAGAKKILCYAIAH